MILMDTGSLMGPNNGLDWIDSTIIPTSQNTETRT